MLSLYEMDFVSFRKTLQDVRDYFTQTGHQEYLTATEESRNLETVRAKKQVVSAEVDGRSIVPADGALPKAGNRVYWRVEVPIVATFENATDKKPIKEKLLAKVFLESHLQ